jgi:hypothetical protein
VRKLIADKTSAAVSQLIEQRFGLRLAIRTMGLYLARRAYRRRPRR